MSHSEHAPGMSPFILRHPRLVTLLRVIKYTLARALVLGIMLAVGIYLAVIVANMGGLIDDIYRANIDEAIQFMVPPAGISEADLDKLVAEMRASMTEMYGLNQPFLLRSARWAWDAATFDWGTSYRFSTRTDLSTRVIDIINERLVNTMLLFTVANLLVFIFSIMAAFVLFRRYGGLLDQLLTNLSVISSIPNWIIAAVLTVLLSIEIHLFPVGGMYDPRPVTSPLDSFFMVARHMVLPVLSIFIGLFFQSVAAWRSLFLLQASEDYVELAKAKGLPDSMIDRRYLVRPTLPFIITNFAMLMVSAWQNSIALELWFNWPGIGLLLYYAFGNGNIDRSLMLPIIVVFAYILALTVFLLEVVYALLDPRVKLESGGETAQVQKWRLRLPRLGLRRGEFRLAPHQPPARRRERLPEVPLRRRWQQLMESVRPIIVELGRNRPAVAGLLIILGLVLMSAYTVIAYPYQSTIRQWRPDYQNWYLNPKNARPAWLNWFSPTKLPPTMLQDSAAGEASKAVTPLVEGGDRIQISYYFDYPYDDIPQDINLYFDAVFEEKRPFVSLIWITPDGRELRLNNFAIISRQNYYLTGDKRLESRLGNDERLMWALFSDPDAPDRILQGRYELRVDVTTFEEGNDVDAVFVLYGQSYGWAGTDNNRRDIGVALLWGAPVALTFGLVGTIFSTLATLTLAALGAWFGGWVDDLIQRLTEISMIMPMIPIAMMIFYLYNKSIWAILAVIVLLSIFGSPLKNYRAVLLQVRSAPYIEAARAYGTSDWRMVWTYLVPRVLPVIIPQMIVLIPGFVFLETTLAFLGISDIYLPTWGKLLYEALQFNALQFQMYWVLEPIVLLLLTGLSFTLLGVSLDRILNPKLRQR